MDFIMDFSQLSNMALVISSLSFLVAVALSFRTPVRTEGEAKNGKQYPNGPKPIPIFGNIFSFSALKTSPDQELLRIARKYGSICMLWFGSSPVIIVSSPKVAKDLMDKVKSLCADGTQTCY